MVPVKLGRALTPVVSSPWSQTLFAYGTSQAALAIGAFLRIPLLVAAVAASGYGSIVAFSGLCVVVMAIADGLAQTTRAITAERVSPDFGRYSRLHNLALSVGSAIVLGFLAASILRLVLARDSNDLWASGLICVALSAVAVFGGPAKGLLEATGKTAQVHLLQASTTIIGLPLLVLALHFSPSLFSASAVTGLGLALPYLAYSVASRGVVSKARVNVRRRFYGVASMLKVKELKSVKSMTVWTWSNSLNYAFDASIVGLVAGTVAAGEFGLASRIMTLAMLLSLALNPLITARVSAWRTTAPLDLLLVRVKRLSLYLGVISLVLCSVSVALGPWLASVLSHDQIHSNRSLYISLAIFAFLSAITAPLMAVFAGVGGVKFRAQVSAILAIVNVCLSVLLTLFLGIIGPSISSGITLSVFAIVLMIRIKMNPNSVMERY